ncbi:MAG: hypothetical protein AAGC44_05345 [Planctomycetota bacterium]
MIEITTRPIVSWPGSMTPPGKRLGPRYTASPVKTRRELLAELSHLKAAEAFIQGAYRADQIRVTDGMPRSGARPAHPGIILTYTLADGSAYQLPCDTFRDSEQNLRAIVLTMQRLRLVDESGVKTHGRQYEGFKQLPPSDDAGANSGEPPSPQAAAELLATIAELPAERVRLILSSPSEARGAFRLASRKAHPDHGGNAAAFAAVCRARDILAEHHGEAES